MAHFPWCQDGVLTQEVLGEDNPFFFSSKSGELFPQGVFRDHSPLKNIGLGK